MRSSSVSPYDLQDWAKRAGFELTEETLPPRRISRTAHTVEQGHEPCRHPDG